MNTRSSTETELVSVHDVMPDILWTKLFLQGQGYGSGGKVETILLQDNKRTILLETHGKYSSTKRTKSIDIRYFHVNDKIKKKEIRVEHCPTSKMIADFFTKPLTGPLFKQFRDLILNLKSLFGFLSGFGQQECLGR